MTSPTINELAYESWLIRRLPNNSLRVLYAAVARGPAAVLVPLPWSEVRILDEVHDRTAFWKLWEIGSTWPYPEFAVAASRGERHTSPMGSRRPGATGERGVRLLARDELPVELLGQLPSTWEFAYRFLHWSALHGCAAWTSRIKARQLAPLALVVDGVSSSTPYREGAKFEIVVAKSASYSDVFVIDPMILLLTRMARANTPPTKGHGSRCRA